LARRAELVFVHASELVTIAGGSGGPRVGKGMNSLGIVEDGAVAVSGGKIVEVGDTGEVLGKLEGDYEVVDVSGRLVTPGLIDPHVHLVFAGSREGEL